MTAPHYDFRPTKTRYGANTVREIANAACAWGFDEGVKHAERIAGTHIDALNAELRKLREDKQNDYEKTLQTRLRVARALAAAMNEVL